MNDFTELIGTSDYTLHKENLHLILTKKQQNSNVLMCSRQDLRAFIVGKFSWRVFSQDV